MPALNPSPVELTTAATDFLLAVECLLAALWFAPKPHSDSRRAVLWTWVLGLTAAAALLGAWAHGFAWSGTAVDRLFMPLYLSLGIVVALFVVGAIQDWRGEALADRLVPWAVAAGAGFFLLTQVLAAGFLVLVVYEAVAMLAALGIYAALAVKRRLPGAARIACAIVLNLVAAAVQATDLSLTLVVPFDHNGLFHMIQMPGVAVLALGLRAGFVSGRMDCGTGVRE